MSAATAVPLLNGFLPTAPAHINEAEEYEKILRLRDEVFAGIHPRLTVPAHAIRKLSPLPVIQTPPVSHTNVPPPFSSAPQQSQLPGLSLNQQEPNLTQQLTKGSAHVASIPAEPATSGYDPVLLVKSDELIKAETRMLRERLEKALKDQFEQKRLDARKRPAPGEAKPDFDVAVVLAKALEVAKPEHVVNVSSPKDDVSASQSYDENSLYSSKGPDSTPEAGELDDDASSQNHNSFTEGLGANGAAEVQMRSSQHVPPAVLPHTNFRPGQTQLPSAATHPLNSMVARTKVPDIDLTALDNDDDDEEGEYSPPEAMDQVVPSQGSAGQTIDPRSRPLRRYSELEENGRRPDEGNMRIVRNHIISPIAPQPSRVSPLAVAKESMFLQNPRGRNGRNQRGRDDSPDAGQQLPPRKKRKLERKAEKQRRRLGKGSPDIKDEPVSPPPFHNVQPLGSGRSRPATDDRPILLDDGPEQEVRYVRPSDRYIDSPTQPLSRYAEPMMPLSEPRVMSRTSIRPPADTTDLRRVASLHNMRAEQPREYVEQIYDTPTRVRATSYVRVESPARLEAPRPLQDMSTTYGREGTQSMRIAQSPGPSYREVYQESRPEVRYIPEPMPPPPVERIVVDQYGRRFREIIQQDRASIAPRPAPAYVDREQPVYYDDYDRARATSVMVENAPDPRYVQEMPPPSRMARQMVEPSAMRSGLYEPMSAGRSASVAPAGGSTHPSVFTDTRGEFREPMRMGSVRPPPSRYEEPTPVQMLGRAPSVRPSGRETSMFVDDRAPVRRDYVPVEMPQYRVLDQSPRYVDAQGREVVMEGAPSGGPRYVQRY